MTDVQVPTPDLNPYDPYDETNRYRAFRDGWASQRTGRSRTANPYPFAQVSEALAWLDGWTAALGGGERPSVDRRRQAGARRLEQLDYVWKRPERSAEAVEA